MMKTTKMRIKSVTAICLAITLLVSWCPFASAENYGYVSLKIGCTDVYNSIYDETYALDPNDPSIKPVLVDERTMLPMRAVVSLFSFDGPEYLTIEWDATTNSALIFMSAHDDEEYIDPIAFFQIGSTTAAYFKGDTVKYATIPVAPMLINDRAYLPLRAVIDSFAFNGDGYTSIEWVDEEQGILIYFGDRPSRFKFPK